MALSAEEIIQAIDGLYATRDEDRQMVRNGLERIEERVSLLLDELEAEGDGDGMDPDERETEDGDDDVDFGDLEPSDDD